MVTLAYNDPIVQLARQARLSAAGSNAWKIALVEANIPRVNLGASWETLDPSHDPDAFAAARAYADSLDLRPDSVTTSANDLNAFADRGRGRSATCTDDEWTTVDQIRPC